MYRKLLVDKPYVEIGGIKWATMNIGANSETDYGLYFQWGDTAGYTGEQCGANTVNYKKPFNWNDCVLHNGTSNSNTSDFTKYNDNDGKTVLEDTDDAAVANWGGKWRMPTNDEFGALVASTTPAWTDGYNNSGVPGIVLTDKTDSSKKLFFPAAGYCSYNSVRNAGSYGSGYYWSSSCHTSIMSVALHLYFNWSGSINYGNTDGRFAGKPIRPVWDDSIE